MAAILNTQALQSATSDSVSNALPIDFSGENADFSETLENNMVTVAPVTANESKPSQPAEAEPIRNELAVEVPVIPAVLPTNIEASLAAEPEINFDKLTQFISDTRQPITSKAVDSDDITVPEIDLTIAPEGLTLQQKDETGPIIAADESPELIIDDISGDDMYLCDVNTLALVQNEFLPKIEMPTEAEKINNTQNETNTATHEDTALRLLTATQFAASENAIKMAQNLAQNESKSEDKALSALMANESMVLQDFMPKKDNIELDAAVKTTLNTPVPVNTAFQESINERVMWMVKGDIQSAKIHLDPPELGPIEVKITISHQEAKISFQSAVSDIRDLLNDSSAKLKEMLHAQGMEQVNVDVSDRQTSKDSQNADTVRSHNNKLAVEEEEAVKSAMIKVPAKASGLDLFA